MLLLVCLLLLTNQITCDNNYSPFHDLTNIPINDDHDVVSSNSSTSLNSLHSSNSPNSPNSPNSSNSPNSPNNPNSSNSPNSLHSSNTSSSSSNPSNQFFDLTGHSVNDSSTLNHTHSESMHHHHEKTEPKCEPITLQMCKGIGYNHTKMPNQLNHDTQDEAGLEVNQFYPLVEINCSDDLRLFLCLIYVPVCMEDFNGKLVFDFRLIYMEIRRISLES